MDDEFRTIAGETRSDTRVHGSRFLAVAVPVATESAAVEFLGQKRKDLWDATHHCYAYRIGLDGQVRFHDDGEPAGTAGKPILAAIDERGLTDVLVVVTRYFGGTKLGVGGLVRAYRDAARSALAHAVEQTKFLTDVLDATFPHTHIGNVMHVVSQTGARIIDTTYDEDVHTRLEVRTTRREVLESALISHTRGNIALKRVAREP